MKIKNILFAVSPLIVAPSIAQTEKTPNIILIMADDLGWGDVGFNGNKEIKTPYMDGLASEGVIFEQFYSAAPLSSPTRASVLTGRNAYRMGVFAPNIGILRPEEITIPELLKEKGYTSDMEKALIMDLGQWMDRAESKMSLSDSYTIDFLILK